MNRVDSVNLAREEPVEIGSMRVVPGLRRADNGKVQVTLEPLVLQVLLTLHRHEGHILSRQELIDLCWGGRAVSDDALDRVVARIRRLAEGVGQGSFRLETIPKVGYRLLEFETSPSTSAPQVRAKGRRPPPRDARAARFRSWLWPGMAIMLLTLAGLSWSLGVSSPRTPSLALAVEGDAGLSPADIVADLAALPMIRAGNLVFIDPGSGVEPTYRALMTSSRSPQGTRIGLSLAESRTGELVWSGVLEGRQKSNAALTRQIVNRLGHVLGCATGEGLPLKSDGVAFRLYLAACGNRGDAPDRSQIVLLRQLVAREPRFAPGWADLAWVEASLASQTFPRDTGMTRALRSAARAHIGRAERLDPRLGAAHAARAELLDRRAFVERLDIEERGLALDPDHPQLHALVVRSLQSVGLLEESVIHARQAVSLDPLSADRRANLILALAHAGRVAPARRELRILEQQWPGADLVRDVSFRLNLRYGDPREALRMLAAGEVIDAPGSAEYLQARLDPSPENRRAAIAQALDLPAGTESLALQILAEFGDVDGAYALLDRPGAIERLRAAVEILFRPHMRAFYRDRRFPALAERLGLAKFWRSTNRWPDLCLDAELAYRCEVFVRAG